MDWRSMYPLRKQSLEEIVKDMLKGAKKRNYA